MLAVLFLTFFVLLLLNVPIAFALGIASTAALLYEPTLPINSSPSSCCSSTRMHISWMEPTGSGLSFSSRIPPRPMSRLVAVKE